MVQETISEWIFTTDQLEHSPSRKDNISSSEETELRIKTCKFILECANALSMPQVATSTAWLFFHRFFIRQSFKSNDRFLLGSTCLFLAGKVSECPHSLNAIVRTHYQIRKRIDMESTTGDFIKTRQKIIALERILLHTMAFDLVVILPHIFMQFWVDEIVKCIPPSFRQNDDAKALKQHAWNFINDASATSIVLQFDPKAIAFAAVYLSVLYAGLPDEAIVRQETTDVRQETSSVRQEMNGKKECTTRNVPWWMTKLPVSKEEDFGLSQETLDAVCSRMLERYKDNPKIPVRISTLLEQYPTAKRTWKKPQSEANVENGTDKVKPEAKEETKAEV